MSSEGKKCARYRKVQRRSKIPNVREIRKLVEEQSANVYGGLYFSARAQERTC